MTGLIEKETLEKLAEKASEFLGKIANPPLEELGGLLADKVRYWRFKNQVNILLKARHFLEEKGIKPKKISLRTLVPLLEHSSWEEDTDMQTKWASLLANVLNPNYSYDAASSYVEILKQLSPLEAAFLDILFDENEKFYPFKGLSWGGDIVYHGNSFLGLTFSSASTVFFAIPKLQVKDQQLYSQVQIRGQKIEVQTFDVLIDNLSRFNLLQSQPFSQLETSYNITNKIITLEEIHPYDIYKVINLTSLGRDFVRICRFK